jgi:hypothetical protein
MLSLFFIVNLKGRELEMWFMELLPYILLKSHGLLRNVSSRLEKHFDGIALGSDEFSRGRS